MTHDDTGGSVPALRTTGLGKRYGQLWGLRDCSLSIPPGAIVGLVGPNGAGKTTLLEMIIGLRTAHRRDRSRCSATPPTADTAESLARVGYVAQNHPLYPDFSVADMFHLGQAMNPNWDMGMARARMEALDIPLKRKVKTLSGGQQAQVALAMALAKRAPLLVLDEPVASLDPVARLEFMREVMAQVAGGGLTVIIASHVVSELERFCDWLVVLTHGHVQLAGPVDELLEEHQLLTVPRATAGRGPARHPHPPHRQRPALVRAAPHQPGRAGGPAASRLADRGRRLRAARHGLPAAPGQGGGLQQPRPGRAAARADHEGDVTMIWVSWRQHRSQAITGLGLLCALAVYGIVLGLAMRNSFSQNNLATCLAHSLGAGCPNSVATFDNSFGSLVNIGFWAVLLLLPGLIGVVVGAPLLGREMEMGTWRLAWSQTVPRTRWLVIKLAVVAGGLIVLGAAMTLVITWYRAPMDRLTGHFVHNAYDYEGLVFTAYILFAFGLAVLAGQLLRRSIPAMLAALVPWVAIRLVVEFALRPHFMAPLTFSQKCPCSNCGQATPSSTCHRPPGTSGTWSWAPAAPETPLTYYQPASRFWEFQSIEAGIFVALTLIALGAAVWLVHRRGA